jgi:hypothetical protein
MELDIQICPRGFKTATFSPAMFLWNTKRLKLILSSSSLMPVIVTKWLKAKDVSLIKDARKSYNSKIKLLKAMTRHLWSSMRKELIPFASKCLLMQASLPSAEPNEEIWKELYLLAEDQQSTQWKSLPKLI